MSDDISTEELALDSITTQALSYARVGMAVFPVHADSKAPMPGYGWAIMAGSKQSDVVIDFTNAILLWGHDNVSVAWALGNDGCMAVDIDRQPEPGWVAEIEPDAAVNITRRGRHLYFKNPPGLVPGNGTSHFPTQGGFDVRGAGGYVVIAGPDRPGFDPSQLAWVKPYPVPDHLTPYGGYTTAATSDEVRDFDAQHRTSKGDQYLNWLRTAIETQWQPGNAGDPRSGRHPLACEWLAKVADESQLGLYPFRDGVLVVREWWRSVTPPERWKREWNGMLSWAVGRALAKASSPPTDSDAGSEPEVALLGDTSSPYIDWAEFWLGGATDHDWLVEGFWPLGRAMLLHAPAKEGKSELVMWWAVQMATGIDLLTGEQITEPKRVLYVDYEMTDADVRDRLTDFGIDASLDLSNLLYAMRTDDFTGLDTAAGGAACLARVDADHPDVIIFDTFSRCVDGDENEADTVRAFFRHTGRPIKSRGISYLRLDHTGKDHAKGARGSSAKNDDVDLIWSLRRNQTGQTLVSKSRVSWVPSTLHIDRLDGDRIAYRRGGEISEMVASTAETEKVYQLDEAGVDPDWSFRQVREHLIAAGITPGKNSTLMAAIKSYRAIKARGGYIKRPTERTDDET